jgi:hypothetical protein
MPIGLLPMWLGLRGEVGNEFTSVPSPLPDRSGPTHNAGSTSAARNLAVAPLRISRGRQYRRLLLTDSSKPVSAGRGLPTLTSQAHPGAASDDRRDQEAGNYGRARDNIAIPVVTLDALSLSGLWPSVPKLETRLLNLQNVSTGRVKFTRESNQSQDRQSVPHNLGE